ncbi:MAG: hypothetical protein P1T08_17155 [Acidimicrobiia bacterium]|nr:hypothetical protein [Acidimicrobiia bacterium]
MDKDGGHRPSAAERFAATTITGPIPSWEPTEPPAIPRPGGFSDVMSVAPHAASVAEWISRTEHVRWLRAQRHLAIAVPAAALCAFVAPILKTLGGLPLFVTLVFVVLDSLARALDARLGYLWGWLYSEPKRSTRLDLIADRIIRRLLMTIPMADSPISQVQVVDP